MKIMAILLVAKPFLILSYVHNIVCAGFLFYYKGPMAEANPHRMARTRAAPQPCNASLLYLV